MTTLEEAMDALQFIANLLGGSVEGADEYARDHWDSCISCEGCRFEMEEALTVARNLLAGKSASAHWGPSTRRRPVHFRCSVCQKERPDDHEVADREGWGHVSTPYERTRVEKGTTVSIRCPDHMYPQPPLFDGGPDLIYPASPGPEPRQTKPKRRRA